VLCLRIPLRLYRIRVFRANYIIRLVAVVTRWPDFAVRKIIYFYFPRTTAHSHLQYRPVDLYVISLRYYTLTTYSPQYAQYKILYYYTTRCIIFTILLVCGECFARTPAHTHQYNNTYGTILCGLRLNCRFRGIRTCSIRYARTYRWLHINTHTHTFRIMCVIIIFIIFCVGITLKSDIAAGIWIRVRRVYGPNNNNNLLRPETV
jgi:hypothetical protein